MHLPNCFVALFVFTALTSVLFSAARPASTPLSHVSSVQTNPSPFKVINYTLRTYSSACPSPSSFDLGKATVTLKAGGSSLGSSVQNRLTISRQYIEPGRVLQTAAGKKEINRGMKTCTKAQFGTCDALVNLGINEPHKPNTMLPIKN